jgi:hypothetical protein
VRPSSDALTLRFPECASASLNVAHNKKDNIGGISGRGKKKNKKKSAKNQQWK